MSYPILYEANAAALVTKFNTFGLGILSDAISCKVTEERNGEFELEMEYPVDGIHFSDISVDRLITAKSSETSDQQIFRIYKIEKPIDGQCTIYAEHISYLLSKAVTMPFSTASAAAALNCIPNYIQWDTDNPNFPTFPFTFWTDSDATGEYTMEVPNTVRSILGGTDGSILDVFGGEYEFDNFEVKLYKNRGTDNHVSLRYGKNITDLKATDDISNVYTGILPYWKGTLQREVWDAGEQRTEVESYDVVVYLTESGNNVKWSEKVETYSYPLVAIVDCSSDIESDFANEEIGDTVTHYTDVDDIRKQLDTVAANYLSTNKGWEPANNIEVSFVNLWDTPEYEDFAALQKVSLCDTVHITYPVLDIEVSMKVITTEYNVLLERYDKIELGEPKSSMSSSIIKSTNTTTKKITELDSSTKSALEKAMSQSVAYIDGNVASLQDLIQEVSANLGISEEEAIALIQAALKVQNTSYIYFDTDANTGAMTAMYIQNKADHSESTSYWKWNHEGLYYWAGGKRYNFALDNLGNLNASAITTGTLTAAVLKGVTIGSLDGTMTIDMSKNSFRMNNGGTFEIRDINGKLVVALADGSSGWGLYAKTFDGGEAYFNKGGTSNANWSTFINGSTTWGIDTHQIAFHNGGDGCGYLRGFNGGIYYNTSLNYEGSDRRIKQDIDYIDEVEALSFITSLTPRKFKFISRPNVQQYGFIAQEVEEVLPKDGGIVQHITGEKEPDGNDTDMYVMCYNAIIPFLVSVAQQQENRIVELENQITALYSKINAHINNHN